MKKLLLVFLMFSFSNSYAQLQLEKGAKLAGAQLNLLVNDMYYTMFEFGSKGYEKYFGISIAPMYGVAIKRNWILGAQATLGIEGSTFNGWGMGYTINYLYTDFGLAPFTRLYLDITRNGKLKIFGTGALEFNIASRKISFPDSPTSTTHYSKTTINPSVGGGIAYFGRRISFDASMSTQALRIGFYKVISPRKK
ncbi:MAG: hypothetical protein V4557_17565 [Bacteroidota bacterium]